MEDFAKIELLEKLKKSIENMDKINQIEVLRVLNKNGVFLNENKNGVYVNLTELSDEVLRVIVKFVEYVDSQENQLNKEESEKQEYKNTYFCNKL